MAALAGCGEITDKGNIVIAEVDGETITRGELQQHIRDLEEKDRPIIQYKSDVLRTLNKYIDTNILAERAKELKAAGKIAVDREQARAVFFEENPDKRIAFEIQDPEKAGFTEMEVVALQTDAEFGIDEVQERLERDAALAYTAKDLVEAGLIRIDAEDFRAEYEARANELMTFEVVEFAGIRFPRDNAQSLPAAGRLLDQWKAGTPFEEIFEIYLEQDERHVMRSMMENDPSVPRFRPFWAQVSGVPEGGVVGPVPLPAYSQVNADGDSETYPPVWVVLQVIQNVPPRQKTIEEAQRELAEPILRRRTMGALREEHGVKIYEDKLWDPSGYGDQFKDQFIETGRSRE